jgi:histone deacetylase complex regulatory component SIN3
MCHVSFSPTQKPRISLHTFARAIVESIEVSEISAETMNRSDVPKRSKANADESDTSVFRNVRLASVERSDDIDPPIDFGDSEFVPSAQLQETREDSSFTIPATLGSTPQPLLNEALSYLDKIKVHYWYRPEVYNHFLDIMKDFKSGQTDSAAVLKSVFDLFIDSPTLLLDFNDFLPPGYGTKIDMDRGIFCAFEPFGYYERTLPSDFGLAVPPVVLHESSTEQLTENSLSSTSSAKPRYSKRKKENGNIVPKPTKRRKRNGQLV